MLRAWEDLPDFMRVPEVRPYWEILNKKRGQLYLKRLFDILMAFLLLIVLAIPMAVIAILIKLDSPGGVFFRQERVTAYGRRFRIHKFRTMVSGADKIGTAITVANDGRITRIGAMIRKIRLDELPQIFDVINGDMSFVGTRPEIVKYVKMYRPEFNATLLLTAGITSEASIQYKDEEKLIDKAEDIDSIYLKNILPAKMRWNLESIEHFGLLRDVMTMFRTVFAVFGKNYN